MPTSPSREAWPSGYSESERPADRRQRTSDDDTAEPLTPVSGDRQLKYRGNSGKVDVGGLPPNAKVDSCPKGEFAEDWTRAVQGNPFVKGEIRIQVRCWIEPKNRSKLDGNENNRGNVEPGGGIIRREERTNRRHHRIDRQADGQWPSKTPGFLRRVYGPCLSEIKPKGFRRWRRSRIRANWFCLTCAKAYRNPSVLLYDP